MGKLKSITKAPMYCEACFWVGVFGRCEPGMDGEALCPSCNKPVQECVVVTKQHAYSLCELVKWFKKMIEQGHMPDTPGRSNKLTAEYCDELLEDLEEGAKNVKNADEP